jgi:hypothetical protein
LDGTRLATTLGATDTATLCLWVEGVLGLVRGAADDDVYVSGTWYNNQCAAGDPVKLWGSPSLCRVGIATGNGLGCQTMTVTSLETCIKAIRSDICLLAMASTCNEFNSCFPLAVED